MVAMAEADLEPGARNALRASTQVQSPWDLPILCPSLGPQLVWKSGRQDSGQHPHVPAPSLPPGTNMSF